ncbi:phage head-tail joining protein [Listeria monocytogenes]|nr:phage head-tail joining protein [Listeria monocytogenes]MBC2290443.1 head-tail adaptor protein [Listeria welshimeri]EEO6560701.1 head-tail adaptor protein [Listeria monocytogenes]EEO9072198.1 head-tail adaptor protein [Listeria monocytogenes]EIZ1591955.1 head-tail adaptor protein [Listeria monocytogenes]
MPKVTTNSRKWKAEVMNRVQTIDANDRPVTSYTFNRIAYYKTLGVTSTEKYQSAKESSEVVKRINIALDNRINTKDFGIRIADQMYNIERIWTDDDQREMELSLSYVD